MKVKQFKHATYVEPCMEFLLIFSEILLVMHLYGNHIELNPYFLMVFGSFPEISIELSG